jgi:acetyl-CoA carboxylase/biotin carboxylase 1
LPIVEPTDSIDRSVEISIPKGAYDPRILLRGIDIDGEFKKGFFDSGSVQETLAGWAKGVVIGRARLGGLRFD